jgi:hypothetical protein
MPYRSVICVRTPELWARLLLLSALAWTTSVEALEMDAQLRLRADYYPDAPSDGIGGRALARFGLKADWLGAKARMGVAARRTSTPWQSGGFSELRAAHLTWAGDWGSFRLGHQQVAWGRADLFRLLDIVNPWRFPDALYDDLADAREPIWMGNLELAVGMLEWQLLAGINDRLDSLDPGYPNPGLLDTSQPRLNHPEPFGGVKAGVLLGDLALNLYYLNQADLSPVGSLSSPGPLNLFERRRRMMGISADWPIGSAVLRLEAASSDTETVDARLKPVDQNRQQLLMGMDFQPGGWLISPQLYLENQDRAAYDLGDTTRRFGSLLVSRRLFQDQLEVKALGALELGGDEYWLSLRLGYTVNDHVELRVHGDWFHSYPGGLLGTFSDLTRVGVETVVRY